MNYCSVWNRTYTLLLVDPPITTIAVHCTIVVLRGILKKEGNVKQAVQCKKNVLLDILNQNQKVCYNLLILTNVPGIFKTVFVTVSTQVVILC